MAETVEVQWNIAQANEAAAAEIAAAVGVSPLTGQLLLNRGVTDREAARRYLDPCLDDLLDPTELPDIERAVDRLQTALEKNEKIFLHGDYDADGVTSAALCLRALTALGANITGFVPSRADGYDLQRYGVDRAKAMGATLILTADCGSCAIDAIAYAKEQGIDVIVTDHHRPGPTLPEAVAIVNPYRDDTPTTPAFRDLCGAGVAFKLIDALCARIAPQHRAAFRTNFLDLVAVGTVADMTSLRSENRVLVTHGLRSLAAAKKTGLRALLATLKLEGKALETSHIGWHIGPRLNAAGRMEDADLAYRLLITRDPAEADDLAAQLDVLASRSREESARITTEAMIEALLPQYAEQRVLVLARENWATGVIGVAATRVVEQCRRPVILLSHDVKRGIAHGSARSFGEFNLHTAFHACSDLLHRFGGHSGAAGLALPMENLDRFRERMHELADGLVIPPAPTLEIDAELQQGGALTYNLVEQLQRLAPFGMGNPEPTFVSYGAIVLGAKRMGKDQSHCQMTLRLPGAGGSIRAVWFRNGDWAERVGMGDEIDLVYTPVINDFNGRISVELSIKDMRAHGLANSTANGSGSLAVA